MAPGGRPPRARRPGGPAYRPRLGLFDWRRFSLERVFADASDPIEHPAYLMLALAQTLAFALAVFARLLADPLLANRPAARRALSRAATIGGLLAAVGLVILLFRWQPVPFLSKRLWFHLWCVGVLAALAWALVSARRHGVRGTVTA